MADDSQRGLQVGLATAQTPLTASQAPAASDMGSLPAAATVPASAPPPAPKPVASWDVISADPRFQAQPAENRLRAKEAYFTQVIAPRIPRPAGSVLPSLGINLDPYVDSQSVQDQDAQERVEKAYVAFMAYKPVQSGWDEYLGSALPKDVGDALEKIPAYARVARDWFGNSPGGNMRASLVQKYLEDPNQLNADTRAVVAPLADAFRNRQAVNEADLAPLRKIGEDEAQRQRVETGGQKLLSGTLTSAPDFGAAAAGQVAGIPAPVTFSALQAMRSYGDAKARGLSDDDALVHAGISAGVNAVAFPLSEAAGGGLGDATSELVGGAASKVATDKTAAAVGQRAGRYVQQGMTMAGLGAASGGAEEAYDEYRAGKIDYAKLASVVGQEAAQGFVSGLTFGAGEHAIHAGESAFDAAVQNRAADSAWKEMTRGKPSTGASARPGSGSSSQIRVRGLDSDEVPDLLRSDLPSPTLTPDEHAVAANAAGIDPKDVPANDVATLAAHAERDPESAQQLVNDHETDAALAAAARAAAVPDASRTAPAGAARGGLAEPEQEPLGDDGQRGLGAPARDASAGKPGQPGTPEGAVGLQVDAPAKSADRSSPLDGAPPPRAQAARPWIRTDTHVPLGGGKTVSVDPDTGKKLTLIDPSISEWKWQPEAKQWVNQWEEIDDHEQKEEPELDIKGYGHPADAHEENGNPATEAYLKKNNPGVSVAEYGRNMKPELDEAKGRAERGEADNIRPDLDRRPYAKYRDLLKQQQPTPEAAATDMVFDRNGAPYTDYRHRALLPESREPIPVVTAKADDGQWAVLDPKSGTSIARGESRAGADQRADDLARRLGRKQLQKQLDQNPPLSQEQLRSRYVAGGQRGRFEAQDSSRPGRQIEQPSQQPQGRKTPLDDQRLQSAPHVAELQRMADNAGWAQIGGQMIRTADPATFNAEEHRSGGRGVGDVTGRTPWVPNEPWFAGLQRDAGLPGNTSGKATREAVRKATAGEPLSAAEKRHVQAILDEAGNALRDHEEALAQHHEGFTPSDTDLSVLSHRAAELDPDAFEHAAIQFEQDEVGFRRAIQEIIDARGLHQAVEGDSTGAPNQGAADRAGVPAGRDGDQTQARQDGAGSAEDADDIPFSLDPVFELERQTESDLALKEQRRRKAEADARARTEAPSPDGFTLTGSDRAADVGAAAGQQSLFRLEHGDGVREEAGNAATGRPGPNGGVRRGYPITREEAEKLEGAGASVFRMPTRGAGTTSEQAWFLDPRSKRPTSQVDIFDRATRRGIVSIHSEYQQTATGVWEPRVSGARQEPGVEPTPKTPWGEPLFSQASGAAKPAGAKPARRAPRPEPQNIDELARAVSAAHGRPASIEQVPVPDTASGALAMAVRKLFGRKVVFFRGDTPGLNGAYMGGKTLFVNADALRPHASIIGHELLHSIRELAPDIYDHLVSGLADAINSGKAERFKSALNELRGKRGMRPLGADKLHEEMIADILGEHFADPAFIKELKDALDPNAFRRLAAHILEFLQRIASKFTGTRAGMGQQMSQFVDDANAARAAVNQALREVNAREKAAGRSGAPGEPSFALDDQDKPAPEMSQTPEARAKAIREQSPHLAAGMDINNKALMEAVGRGSIKHAYAVLNRISARAERALHDTRAMFDQILSTAEGKAQIHSAIYQWETGQPVSNPQLSPFFRSMKKAFDQRVQAVLATGRALGYWDHYYPHLFKDPNAAQQWMRDYLAHRTLEGGKGWTKERVYETMREARDAGLVPLSENPADMVQAHLRQMDKYISMHQILTDLEKRGLVIDDPGTFRGPAGYAKVSDPGFRGRLVPEVIARDLNTTLGASLYDSAWWRTLRKAENALVSANLGFSAFHGTMTTLDTIAAHLGDAVQRASIGDVGGALRSAGTSLASPILSPFRGTRLIRQSFGESTADAQTAALLRMLEQGGHQVFMSPTDLNDTFVKMRRMMRRGEWLSAGKEAPIALLENISPLIHKHLVPAQKMTAKTLALKFELDRLAGTLGERRGDYAAIEKALSEDAVRQIAGRVVQQVDERLGQMNYRNLFWNRMLRDALQGLFTSFGWQIGTLKTIGGGFSDVRHLVAPARIQGPLDAAGRIQNASFSRLSGRTAYLVGLHALLLGLNAGITYALTGTSPQSIADLYTIRTGRKNPDGSDERLILPSYAKDEIELAKQPFEMAANKMNPVLRNIYQLIRNRDYYGNEIYNPDDDLITQAKQVGEHLVGSAMPYSVEGIEQARRAGKSLGLIAANLGGVNSAPAYMTRTPLVEFLAQRRAMHEIARTPEAAEEGHAYYDALNALRRGEHPDLSQFSPKQQKQLMESSRTSPQEQAFKKLSLVDKLLAYDKASDEERDQYRLRQHILGGRVQESLADMPADQRQKVVQRLREIGREGQARNTVAVAQ